VTREAVTADDVHYAYGERAALAGLSLSVHVGETFALLGPNGGGKTTFFRLLSTALVPQRGRLTILGFDVALDLFEVRRRIGVVFQSPSLDRKLTVAENLTHHGRLYGLSSSEIRVGSAEILARVGLADRATSRVESLSGGLARRAEIAKGLLHGPSVLLLDEPSTGLDPAARSDLWRYLASLAQTGVTILVTTHMMEEAERAGRVGILDKGRLVALGTPDELRSEIGGDVVTIESSEPSPLAVRLQERFGVAPEIVGDRVRFEQPVGYHALGEIVEMAGPAMRSVSVARPTLEDVFLRRTGHRFWTESSHD
jgi:ABC-2 type transport system ATP-binding protein